jgi:hypothetical protein
MQLAIRSLAMGLALTGLTMLVSYDYCFNGAARGFPFAAYCPPCEASFAALGTGGHVIDLVRLFGNVVLWSGICAGLLARFQNRVVRQAF